MANKIAQARRSVLQKPGEGSDSLVDGQYRLVNNHRLSLNSIKQRFCLE